MKTKISRISKASLSILLTVLMIISTMLVGMVAVDAAYTDSHFYLIGDIVGSWSTTSYKISNSYNNEAGKFCIEVNVSSTPVYFALNNGSSQYGPSTNGDELSSGVIGAYNSNAWKYSGSASKVRICINQRSENSDEQWYPYVWLEEVAVTTTYTVSATAQYKESGGSTYSTLSGVTPTVSPSSVTSGNSATITAPTVSGYTFETWAIKSGSGSFGSATSKSTTFKPTSNSALYARYIKESTSDAETHSVDAKSGKTIIVSYDKVSNYRNYAHVWHTNSFVDGTTDAGKMTSGGVTGLYYIDITNNSGLQSNTQINFIAKYGSGWNSDQSADVKNASFVKGKQWYIYQNSSGSDSNAEYTPLELDSLKYGTITGGTANTIKAVPAGGAPWLMNLKAGTAKNYTFNVYVGEGTSGTKIVNAQSVAYNGELSFNWTPNTTDSQQKLTFVLTDGIDSVTYTQTFTVATGGEVTTHTVTVSAGSNGSAYITSYTNESGTVVTNASTTLKTVTVKSGTTVSMKAVPNTGYSVASWNGASSTSTTYTTGSITSNTTIPVTFSKTGGSEEGGSGAPAVDKTSKINGVYLIYGTSNNPSSMTNYINLYKVNGEAIAYFSEDVTNFKAGTTYYFALTSVAGGSTAYQSMYWQSWAQGSYTSFNVTKNNSDLFESCGTQDYNIDNKAYKFPTFRVSAITQDVQISVGDYGTYVEGNTYDIRAYSSLTKAIKIYAKDGTIRDSYQKYVHMADTTFTDTTNLFNVTTSTNQREEAYADLGTTITVQTTIESAYRNKYYVRAFCVNGESYNIIKNTQADKTNGVYTLTYTIPEDFEDDKIEITPIYFYIDETDTITFFVEGFDSEVKEKWGDTIACHAYYTGGGETDSYDSSSKNSLGGYPGQPMVYEGGKYYMQVHKYLNGDTNKPFKGIDLNNFVWDDVHAGRAGGTGNNCQTYDYNDLYCIANLIEDVDNIIFRFKYETKHDNNPDTYPTDSNRTSVYTNGWEELVDYNGDKVDLFGKVLEGTELNRPMLRIVSNGYKYNHIGEYATEWTVYQGSGSSWTKVGTLPSSVLLYPTSADIPDAAKTYNYDDAYKALEAYRGYPAEITYEKSIFGGTDQGNRADGRWYYSFKGEEITANTRIEYAPTLNDEFVEDPFVEGTATGTTTGTKAYFTNAGYEYKTVANGIIDPDSYFEFSAEESVNYMFVGWWLLQDGKYTKFAGRNLNETASMSSNATYVARFIEVPEGRMTVTHRLFTEAPVINQNTPQAHDGTGTCYVKVEVLDSSNNVIYTYTETTGAILIREDHLQATSTNKLRITLRTKMDGLDKFFAYYVNDLAVDGGYSDKWTTDANRGATDETTRELNFNVSELFYMDENDIPVFYVDSLDFYSDIEKVTVKSEITYRYFARYDDNLQGNNKVEYVVRDVELSKDEINNNDCKLSYDTLRQYAPSVDTLYVDTQWVFNEDTVTYDTANNKVYVDAVQQPKLCRVVTPDLEALKEDPTVVVYKEFVEVPYNTWYADAEGEFLLIAPETIGDLKFNRWEVYNLDAQGNKTEELVTVLATERFTLRIMDDYFIVPVYSGDGDVITAHISPPVFNREVFGDSTNPTDRLYVDFLTAFTSQHIPVFNQNESEYTVECGMIVDRNNNLALSAEDRSNIINAATSNSANPLNMDTYKAQFGTDYATIYDVAFDSNKVDKDKVTYVDTNGREHRLTKYVFDNEQLTNKNRIDKVLVYTNNEANQNYIFAAYSYVIIRDVDGNVVASTLTAQEDAQFYNLCYTGHMPASVAA